MKKFIALALTLSALNLGAATVKITRFNLVNIADDLDHPVAELCGKVEGSTKVEFIKILVDQGSRRPSTYNTLSDEKGNFCMALVTYRGSAEVSIIGQNNPVKAELK